MITTIIEEGVKWYGIICDHCNEDWIDEERDIQFMPDEISILNETVGNLWHSGCDLEGFVEGKHYCDKCYEYDEDDVFLLKPERKEINQNQ